MHTFCKNFLTLPELNFALQILDSTVERLILRCSYTGKCKILIFIRLLHEKKSSIGINF